MENFTQKFPVFEAFRFTPIKKGEKRPLLAGWQKKPFKWGDLVSSTGQITYPGAGAIGLLLGEVSGGIIGLDCDGQDSQAYLESLGLPPTLTVSSGAEGRWLKLFRIPPEHWGKIPQKKTVVRGADHFELRWDNHQSLVFGVHPSGRQYRVLETVNSFDEIPYLPPSLFALLKEEGGDRPAAPSSPLGGVAPTGVDPQFLLLSCLAPANRDLIQWGVSEGTRNDSAAALARDLIGTAKWLGDRKGVSADPRALFDEFCSRCSPPLGSDNAKEPDQVWRSAERDNPTPCLSQEKLENCYASALRKLGVAAPPTGRQRSSDRPTMVEIDPSNPPPRRGSPEEERVGQSSLSSLFCDRFGAQYSFDSELEQWYQFSEGYWSPAPKLAVERLLDQLITQSGQPYKADLVWGAAKLCKLKLAWDFQEPPHYLLPLKNGVLDLRNRKLLPHKPEFGFRWQLPYSYHPEGQCPKIQQWLEETVGGDRALVQVLRAFLNCVLLGKTEHQKYLELIGPGGTGKSTFIKLATALVGQRNSFTTELKRLETNRFEAAGLVDKRLCVITDSERYGGSVAILKALTGGDSIPLERKYRDVANGFTPQALVILAANEAVQSSDYTSGLARRRLTVPFRNPVPREKQRNLLTLAGDRVEGEFAEELGGLLNWVLDLSEEEVHYWLTQGIQESSTLQSYRIESLIETNPLAAWLHDCVVLDAEATTQVGAAKKIRVPISVVYRGERVEATAEGYQDSDSLLYPSFCEYCLSTGQKPVKNSRFIQLLEDLLVNTLHLPVQYQKRRHGVFVGLRIRRHPQDSELPSPLEVATQVCDTSENSEKKVFQKHPPRSANREFDLHVTPPDADQDADQNAQMQIKVGTFEKLPKCDRQVDCDTSQESGTQPPPVDRNKIKLDSWVLVRNSEGEFAPAVFRGWALGAAAVLIPPNEAVVHVPWDTVFQFPY